MTGEKHKIVIAAGIVLGVLLFPIAYFVVETKKIQFSEKAQLSQAFQAAANTKPENQGVYVMSVGVYGRGAIPFLLTIFGAEDREAWEGPASALKAMANAAHEISAIALGGDFSLEERRNAVRALSRIGGSKALDTILGIVLNPREVYLLRLEAAQSLDQFDTTRLIEPLFGLLTAEDPKIAGQFYQGVTTLLLDAANRIGATREPSAAALGEAKKVITAGLAHTQGAVRLVAVKFAQALHAKEFLPRVTELAKTDSVDAVKKTAEEVAKLLNAG